MNTIVLERFAYGPDGTFGTLTFPSGLQVQTVECPWLGNQAFKSCIPDGVYPLRKRVSGVVSRTSAEAYREGWEVTQVPERTYIMLHPGNWPTNFEGCIGPGLHYRIFSDHKNVQRNGVTQSQKAFAKIMTELNQKDEWDIEVRPFIMQYP